MHLHTIDIENFLAADNVNDFRNNILTFLKPGKKELYETATKLSQKAPIEILVEFLTRISEEEPALYSFLSAWYLGQQEFAQMNWEQAAEYFEEARQWYDDSYAIKRSAVLDFLQKTGCGIQIQEYAETGNYYYSQCQWESALEVYEKAARSYQKGLPFPKSELMDVVNVCRKGIKYDFHVSRARNFVSEGEWENACLAYEQAKEMYLEFFTPEIDIIEEELAECQEGASFEKNLKGGLIPGLKLKPELVTLGIGVLITCLITLGYNNAFSSKRSNMEGTTTNREVVSTELPEVQIMAVANTESSNNNPELMLNDSLETGDSLITEIEEAPLSQNQEETKELTIEDMFAEIVKEDEPEVNIFSTVEEGLVDNQTQVTENAITTKEINEPLLFAEHMPHFPGGDEAMFKFISQKVTYPMTARDKGVAGKVVVRFLVKKDGSLSNFETIKGIGYGCDEEVIKALAQMPLWIPGQQLGKNVDVWYTFPFSFKLN